MVIYQLTKYYRNSFDMKEETVAFYESWIDANLQKRSSEFNNDNYEYCIYTRTVIPAQGVQK